MYTIVLNRRKELQQDLWVRRKDAFGGLEKVHRKSLGSAIMQTSTILCLNHVSILGYSIEGRMQSRKQSDRIARLTS